MRQADRSVPIGCRIPSWQKYLRSTMQSQMVSDRPESELSFDAFLVMELKETTPVARSIALNQPAVLLHCVDRHLCNPICSEDSDDSVFRRVH